jgi:palmitoyltransferase
MICAQRVFRCFRALERLGDRITGAAGPYFVVLAVILTTTGTVCFCTSTLSQPQPLNSTQLNSIFGMTVDVIAPSLNYRLITLPICLLIALNLHMHYYYVCTVQPGFVDDPPKEGEHGRGLLWAKPRSSSSSSSGGRGVLTGSPVLRGVGGGVSPHDGSGGVTVTPAEITKCRRCGKLRPEVSLCAGFLGERELMGGYLRERTIVGCVIDVC